MIVGNCEASIDRCLHSFAPIADEIICVRAIGAAAPDGTLEIARRFGAITGEYRNRPQHADWRHIDDYAAARNESFRLASSDFILWADHDDTIEAGAHLIREHAYAGGYDAYLLPYDVGIGRPVLRERILRRGSGEWRGRIHEHFHPFSDECRAAADERVTIKHHGEGRNGERNLRIMRSMPMEEMTLAMLHQFSCELAAIGDIKAAIKVSHEALLRVDSAS